MSCFVLTLTSNWSCFWGPAGDWLSLSCIFSSTQQLSVFSGGKATAMAHTQTHTKIKERAWGWQHRVQPQPEDMSSQSSAPCKLWLPSLAATIKTCHPFQRSWMWKHSQTLNRFCLTVFIIKLYFYLFDPSYIFCKQNSTLMSLGTTCKLGWIFCLVGFFFFHRAAEVHWSCRFYLHCFWSCSKAAENQGTVWFSQFKNAFWSISC